MCLKKIFLFFLLIHTQDIFCNEATDINSSGFEVSSGFSRMFLSSKFEQHLNQNNHLQLQVKTPFLWKFFNKDVRPFFSLSYAQLQKNKEDITNESQIIKLACGESIHLMNLSKAFFLTSFHSFNYYHWQASSHHKKYGRKRIIQSNMIGVELGLALNYLFHKNFSLFLQVSQDLPSFSYTNGFRNLSINFAWVI